jgi:hypothetical protein
MQIIAHLPSKPKPTCSWFTGHCKSCGYPVVVTQGKQWDYRWYCSNPDCINHDAKEDLGDMEEPCWVNLEEVI